MDITNPLNFETFDSLVVPADGSATAELAAELPQSRVVKAFNTNFAATLASGTVGDIPTTVLIAGGDAEAKSLLAQIVTAGGPRLSADHLGRRGEDPLDGGLRGRLLTDPWRRGRSRPRRLEHPARSARCPRRPRPAAYRVPPPARREDHHPMTSPAVLPPSRIPDPGQAPPIRWGVLAPGWIAGQFTHAIHRHTRSRVVAVGSTSRKRAEQFAADHGVTRSYDSYDRVVADPDVDAVYVASPHSHHHEQGLLALAAGKPVLIEKAFTQNAAQAAELVEVAEKAGLLLMEAMWARFLPHFDVIRQLLADGSLGEIQTVISDHGQSFDIPPSHRLLNPQLAGGALLDLGVYPISFTSFVLGAPDAITASATMTDTGVDGQVSAILRSGSAHGLVSAGQLAKTPTTATVSGTHARVEIGGDFYQPNDIRLVTRDGDVATTGGGPIRGHDGLAYQVAHFAGLLTDGRTGSPLLPPAESVSIMQTMDEIRRQIGLVYPDERR